MNDVKIEVPIDKPEILVKESEFLPEYQAIEPLPLPPKKPSLLVYLWWFGLVGGLIYVVMLSQDQPSNSAAVTLPSKTAVQKVEKSDQASLFSVERNVTTPTIQATPTMRLPTATPTIISTPKPMYLTYTIESGDLLGEIAARYKVEVADIMELNRLADPTLLQIGQVLQIPITVTPLAVAPSLPPPATPQIHVVKAGDSPLALAFQYDTSVEEIMRVNQIDDPSSLQIGQNLIIPAKNDLDAHALNKQILRYKVRGGDTFLSMAVKYGSTVDDIMAANPGLKPTNLQIEQELLIPLTRPATTEPIVPPKNNLKNPPPVVIPSPSAPGVVGLQQQMIAAVNAYRVANGLPLYQADESLNQIGMARAQDMDTRGYFSHWTPEGKRAADLVHEQGIAASQVSENIQRNTQPADKTVADAIHWFMNDATHRVNILHSRYTRLGVGVSESPGFHTFVLIFAGD